MDKYNGRLIVPSEGPEDADIVVVGESPSDHESGKCLCVGRHGIGPFKGPAGFYLNMALKGAGIDRTKIRLMNLVPVQPDGNKFKNHDEETLQWGLSRFEDELKTLSPKVVVAAGANPMKCITGLPRITEWRGSLIHPDHWPSVPLESNGDFVAPAYKDLVKRPWAVIPTYHPAFILQSKNFPLIWWLRLDFQRARRYARGEWDWSYETRKWKIDASVEDVEAYADRITAAQGGHFTAVDTEQDPRYIISFADEVEVVAFEWDERYRSVVEKIMTAENVLRVAHNYNHDATLFKTRLGITPGYLFADTMGMAHDINPEMRKALSPECSTRFTTWPYHEWVFDYNPVAYCALDTANCADIYWTAIKELADNKQLFIFGHDTKLQRILLKMQWRGIPIDQSARDEVEDELSKALFNHEVKLNEMVEPVIRSRISTFRKPHLFLVQRRCDCCGGGSVARKHCWRCGGLSKKPERKADYYQLAVNDPSADFWQTGIMQYTVAQLKESLPVCGNCEGGGKIDHWLPFNPDSNKQLADVIYRGLAIRPRRYMGKETVRYERLETIRDRHPIIAHHIDTAKVRAEFKTVERLKPGLDGRLHPVFDPFGTKSGRVASREGLLEAGTNVMNIPYQARKLIVAPPGKFLLYPDMEQIEARCVAVLSKDAHLLEIYASGKDSHMEVLHAVRDATGFDMAAVRVGPHAGDGRFFSKKSTYAWMYGIRPKHLAGELGIPEGNAEEIIQAMNSTFPAVPSWQNAVEREVYSTRRVSTAGLHSRKFLERIVDPKTKELDYEILKKALSHKPQDMAAYILALGLMEIDEKYRGLLLPFIHVHDALVLAASYEHKHRAVKAARNALSRTEWNMNFPVGMSVGNNWYICSLTDAQKKEEGYHSWILPVFLAA